MTVVSKQCSLHGNVGCAMCIDQDLGFEDVPEEFADVPSDLMAADGSGRIKLAAVAPPYCASCWNAKPSSPHVTLAAEHEGPVFALGFEDSEVAGGGVAMSDEIVICEDCAREAGTVIGMGDVDELKRELAEAQTRFDALSDRAAAQAAHIEDLERAASSREKLGAALAPAARPANAAARTSGGGRSTRRKAGV